MLEFKMIDEILKVAAGSTPDPERSLNNLSTFFNKNLSGKDEFNAYLREISLLFSVSQFLANNSTSNREGLFKVLRTLKMPLIKTAFLHC